MKRFLKSWRKMAAYFGMALLVLPARASADISVEQQVKRDGSLHRDSRIRTLEVRGLKMRVESRDGSEIHISIYDLEAGKRFRWDVKRRQVYVADLSLLSGWGDLLLKDLHRTIKPTGKRLEIAGMPCEEYEYDIQAPTRPYKASQLVMHDRGTVCLSQVIANGDEYTNFIHEAQKRGFIAAAAVGSPTETQLGAYFYGYEPNVIVLSSQARSDVGGAGGITHFIETKMTTLSIKSDPIPEENFQPPPGWKVKEEPRW